MDTEQLQPGQAEMTERHEPATPSRQRLQRPGIRVLVGTALAPLIEGILLFAAAGTMALPRGWFFLAVCFVGMFGQIALVARKNPELVNQRGRWREKKDAMPWDGLLVRCYGLFAFNFLPIVAGLDVGRYGWSSLGTGSLVVGTALFALGTVVLTWAMLANTHFEPIVRIQTDRDHHVVSSGPYAIVRHPGYVGVILWALASPLILGSAFALIPAGLATLVLVVRTALEDQTLQRELPGYADYAAHTPHRLLPGLW